MAPTTTLPASQLAPDASSGVVHFTRVQVRAGSGQQFTGRADTINTGPDYLNRLTIRWSIVDAAGGQLDQGSAALASLAPGETATISLDGSRPFDPRWAAVRFSLT